MRRREIKGDQCFGLEYIGKRCHQLQQGNWKWSRIEEEQGLHFQQAKCELPVRYPSEMLNRQLVIWIWSSWERSGLEI